MALVLAGDRLRLLSPQTICKGLLLRCPATSCISQTSASPYRTAVPWHPFSSPAPAARRPPDLDRHPPSNKASHGHVSNQRPPKTRLATHRHTRCNRITPHTGHGTEMYPPRSYISCAFVAAGDSPVNAGLRRYPKTYREHLGKGAGSNAAQHVKLLGKLWAAGRRRRWLCWKCW